MRDNEKCNISHVPLHRLKRYSIINTKCIGVIDSEGPEKYNNTEMKSGQLFHGRHTAHNTRCYEYKTFFIKTCSCIEE